jgi:hypothetical protein
MVMFDQNTMLPGQQRTNASFLSKLMTDIRAKSGSPFRLLHDQDRTPLEFEENKYDGGRDNNIYDVFFDDDDLWEMEDVAPLVEDLPTMAVQVVARPPSETEEEEDKVCLPEPTGEHLVDKVPCSGTEG